MPVQYEIVHLLYTTRGYLAEIRRLVSTAATSVRHVPSSARKSKVEAIGIGSPTAALDTESELAVQRAFDALVREKTVIGIAHRLSTIAGADRILVLDEARLVEQGRHEELLATQGRYRRLWDAQQRAKRWHVSAVDR